ncbi:DarT ssDNA thymidine ADP-ribosyltransferase family protein [Pseudomonas sp. JH-2]|uniref:DarT ssDNA thymidine ADP-ribosyltransferase family protein n=1 Tax=Pseudomonas sp. JH-2 TaxID=3114998 RepID=UPI002E2588ED|nr:DarT ssDNA thymidine ADP-ribosyltransferase family protein [Pseudomonas sp. JH-2]
MAGERKLIEDQKWIYHLSSMKNLESILSHGLISRSKLRSASHTFCDVADPEILDGRAQNGLDQYVPFHFFSNNPFDGRVQSSRRDETFFYICVTREKARSTGYSILPTHPLSKEHPQLFDYESGFQRIDWQRMNTRDYKDQETKLVCMAECLSPATVPPQDFDKLLFKTEAHEAHAKEIASKIGLRISTWAQPQFFTKL